ncbi:carboxypeptidase-like regulatory domain-containing protein [Pedobacter sp. NJ-S-72]
MKLKLLQLLSLLILLSVPTFAQNRTITGKVVDQTDHQPVPGVSVRLHNKNSGTITNAQGEFTISLSDDEKKTLISAI